MGTHRIQQANQSHQQSATGQPPEVCHIGHIAVGYGTLQQLIAHPHRQHDERRQARIVEIEQDVIKKPDALQAIQHGIHAHQPRDRARGPQPVTTAAGIRPRRHDRCPQPRQQISPQVQARAQRFLQREAEDE